MAARIAAANGCSLRASSAAATSSTCSRVAPSVVATSMTTGRLRVRVPVLSRATPRIVPRVSSAAPPLTSTPSLLAAPIAATTVTGTEIASAHGDAATRTTRARSIHTTGSPSRLPITAISAAAIITPGTRGLAMRSARRWLAPLRDCSASTIFTILASELSSAVVVDLDGQDAGAVDRPGEHLVTGSGLDRHRLTGDRRDVQRGAARRG